MTEALPIMKRILSEGKLSIFAGSGISVDSGLPTWDGFVDKYINICMKLNNGIDSSLQFEDIINVAFALLEDVDGVLLDQIPTA